MTSQVYLVAVVTLHACVCCLSLQNIGKGSLWMIDPDFRPNLLQALRKTPYHPYHQLQMFNSAPTSLYSTGSGG